MNIDFRSEQLSLVWLGLPTLIRCMVLSAYNFVVDVVEWKRLDPSMFLKNSTSIKC